MNEEERVCVRFYFISGGSQEFTFSKTFWERIKKLLETNWNNSVTLGDDNGINFSTVMYFYVVK